LPGQNGTKEKPKQQLDRERGKNAGLGDGRLERKEDQKKKLLGKTTRFEKGCRDLRVNYMRLPPQNIAKIHYSERVGKRRDK
jgi:hypothetical protein